MVTRINLYAYVYCFSILADSYHGVQFAAGENIKKVRTGEYEIKKSAPFWVPIDEGVSSKI